jgi:hypothetical protein
MADDESASEYAIGAAKHEPRGDVDACARRPYMAGHARPKCDHRSCQAPPPSLPRYGASAHARLAKQALVPPVPRHHSPDILVRGFGLTLLSKAKGLVDVCARQ